MTKMLRWGLISTARINAKVIPAIRQSARSELSAIASRDKERARQYALDWNIPNAFGSYEDMLQSDQIDAVYISLPNNQHAEWSIKALQAGKHVLCEKPFAISLDEVNAMIAAAHKFGRVLAEAFMYLHHPQTHVVQDVIRSGKLGSIRALHGAFHFSLASLSDIRAIASMGGGSIWDVGVYPISYFQWMVGAAPTEVSGQMHLGPTGIDMTFSGQLTYPGGEIAVFTSSFKSPRNMRIDIYGAEGRLEITRPFADMENGQVKLISSSGAEEILTIPHKYLYLGQIEDMELSALEGKPQLLSLQATRSHVLTVLSLLQSAQDNRAVQCSWSLD
jgi:predicted dehydrogenase